LLSGVDVFELDCDDAEGFAAGLERPGLVPEAMTMKP
jgi:hypothetical protein